mmetsp:Transcript_8132/g.9278  ORF Transcript_8132/g.9278 Transcript_8132/m.9278 type:complete len:115 (+) Transcript_8132:34-378(+)
MVFALPAWNYFSKGNFYQRHRIMYMYTLVLMTGYTWVARLKITQHNEFVKGSLHYTTDDSDFEFRNSSNMTDEVVKHKIVNKFREKVLAERSLLEREMQLDAFNYLYNTDLNDE